MFSASGIGMKNTCKTDKHALDVQQRLTSALKEQTDLVL